MIGAARAVLRLAGAGLWLILIAPVVLTSALLGVGSRGRLARNGARVHRAWAAVLGWMFGFRVRVEGERPHGAAFLASNHLTHFDIPVLAARFPMQFVAKAEIARWPVFGWLALLAGTIYVDRSARAETPVVAAKMRRYLQHGATVTLFPEGTCGDGRVIKPFKAALFAVPAELGLPTVPVAIRYAGAGAAWTEGSMSAHMFRMLREPRIEARVRFGAPIPPMSDRKALAIEANRRVAELYASLAPSAVETAPTRS